VRVCACVCLNVFVYMYVCVSECECEVLELVQGSHAVERERAGMRCM
jgi:hypothetical protein